MTAKHINKDEYCRACGAFGTGVTVISACEDGAEHAMTANAFMSISLDPAIIAVSVADEARMCNLLLRTRRFAVSILPEGSENLALHFAGKRDPWFNASFFDCDRLPVLKNSSAWFTADVCDISHVGDHHVFFGRVSRFATNRPTAPLIYYQGQFGAFSRATRSEAQNAEQG